MGKSPKSSPQSHSHYEAPIAATEQHGVIETMRTMEPADQARGLAMALLAERHLLNPQELHQAQARMEYAYSMQRKMLEFSKDFEGLESHIHGSQKLASGLLNRKLAAKRKRTVVGENTHVITMDRLAHLLRDETDYLNGFIKSNLLFLSEARPEENSRLDKEILLTDPRVHKTIERTDGFQEAIANLQDRMDRFPELCRDVSRAVNRYRQQLSNEYGKEEEDGDSPGLPSFFFFTPEEPKDPVPLYKSNVHLTGFLNHAYDTIPVLVQKKKGDVPRIDSAEIRGYTEYLRSLSDRKLLTYVQEGGFFPKAADVLENVCDLYNAVQKAIQKSGIEKQKVNHPENSRLRFLDEIDRNRRLTSEEGMRGETFRPGPILSLLRGMHLHSMPTEMPTLGPDEGSKKERTILGIFAKIEEKLEGAAKNDMHDGEWEEFIKQIAGAKYDVKGTKAYRRRTRIRRDKMDENWAYRVQTRGVRSLDLKQIPTTNVTFDDVIGKSWQEMRKAIDDILQWDRLEHIFTTLHPRGNAKKHIMAFGSWGIGKNHFSRAILNDPRVVGITLTTGDIGTAYVNESEANVGRLFEESREVRDKHGKPVALVWDEFDDLFPKKGEADATQNNIRRGMQKELQSNLDGNLDNSGIFLFGISNAPETIPIEVYRRMRHIGIIEPLDDVERYQLLDHLLKRMPLEDNFMHKVDIGWMNEVTEDASGEILGTIIDETYERLVDAMRNENHSGLTELNDALDDMVRGGEKPSVTDRLALVQEIFPNTAVSPEMFQQAAISVLKQPGIREQMDQQNQYYKTIHGRLSKSFEGWEARPDFLPPSEPEERGSK